MQKRKYLTTFALENHVPIHKVSDIKRGWGGSDLYLFCNKTQVGHGSLCRLGNNTVHTENVRLRQGFRKKGHGIKLYLALIRAAKSIGADRIYSSMRLNKHSRRMWSKKLMEYYDVKSLTVCKDACRHCQVKNRFYIVLKGLK